LALLFLKENYFKEVLNYNITEKFNEWSCLMIIYFLKEQFKNKHYCHIGSASGDIDMLLSKYAKKFTIVECDVNRYNNIKKREII
jgi:hypothetical protein